MNGNYQEGPSDLRRRIRILTGFVVCAVGLYVVYLFGLQIVNGSAYKERAYEMARRVITIPAQRGEIFDRNYDVPLVTNKPSFAINLIPGEVGKHGLDAVIGQISSLVKVPVADIRAKIPTAYTGDYQPIEVASGVPYSAITYIAEHLDQFPGVTWQSKPIRSYLDTGSISHVLGYVGDITREELQVLYNNGYDANSTVGKNGVEKEYDSILRGTDGKSFRTVDVRGRRVEDTGIEDIPPVDGKNIVLTIDRRVQDLAEKALGDRMGSVVVLKPATGEILALVSYPWYDPNIFSSKSGAAEMRKVFLDPRFPFLDRAIQSAYSPASTFKIIMTACDLEENAFPPTGIIDGAPSMEYGGRVFHDWEPSGEGPIDLPNALAMSSDVYFWTLGTKYLGVDRIVEYARRFGLGQRTGIDLPGEVAGLVPTPEWKENVLHSPWVGGDTMNISIGQGNLLVTPLQLADVVAMVANGGVIYKPHVLKEIRDPTTGAVIREVKPEVLISSGISKNTFTQLQAAMRGVIVHGTAKVVITTTATKIAGKTGTGQVGLKERFSSWFASYAPYDAANPDDEIVVVTMIEATNNWDWWAPKAANIIYQGYFAHQDYDHAVNALVASASWYLQPIRIQDR